MADYQAKIQLLVAGQQRLRDLENQLNDIEQTITNIESRWRTASSALTRSRTVLGITGRDMPRGQGGRFAQDPDRQQRLAALGEERRAQIQQRAARLTLARTRAESDGARERISGINRVNRAMESQITLEARLNSAVDLYQTNLRKFTRGGSGLVDRGGVLQQQVQAIQQAFAAFEAGGSKNLQLVRALATELGRVVEAQNELNRAQSMRSRGFEAARALQERLDVVGGRGLVSGRRTEEARRLAADVITTSRSGDQRAYQEALRKATAATRRLERETNELDRQLREQARASDRAARAAERSARDDQREIDRLARLGGPRSPVQGGVDIPGSPKFMEARAERMREQTSGVLLGAGFPLLFGGGPGAVLGGALGGLVPGEGAFAAQIGLSALGQQLDKFAQFARNAGDALKDPTKALEFLGQIGYQLSESTSEYVKALVESGRETEALAYIQQNLADAIGVQGVKNLKNFDTEMDRLQNAFVELALTVAAEVLPYLTKLITKLADFAEGLKGPKEQRQLANLDPEAFRRAQEFARKGSSATLFGGDPELEERLLTEESKRILAERTAVPEAIKELDIKKETFKIELAYQKARKEGSSFADKQANVEAAYARDRAKLQLEYDKNREKAVKRFKETLDATGKVDLQAFEKLRGIQQEQLNQDTQLLDVQTNRELLQLRIEETRRREASIVEAQLMREQGAIDLASQRYQMQESIASAATSAYLAINDLEMQRATNAGDTEKQYRLQLERAQLIYQQTVLQVEQEQRKAQLAVLNSQLKLKELQADVARKAAKGEALAEDYAAIELQKQAVQLAYEGVNAAKMIAQYTLMGADAIRQMKEEQAAFNRVQAAGRAGGGGALGGGGGAALGGGGGNVVGNAVVTSTGGTRFVGTATPESLARELSAKGVSGVFTEGQASAILGQIQQAEVAKAAAEKKARTEAAIARGAVGTGFAQGGFVTGPTNALIGEAGDSEYVIPSRKMDAAMSRYASGVRGEGVVAGASSSGDSTAMAASGGRTAVNITTGPVLRVDNTDYVKMADMQRGMAAAANAAQSNTMRSMSRSYAARRSMGL